MADRWILQLCHGHSGPFLDVARQYAVLFVNTPFKVLTVYLTGKPSEQVRSGSASDEVIFLNFSSRAVRGLKLDAVRKLKKIAASRDFALVIAHRFKSIYVACLATNLPVIGVHHGFGDYDRPPRRWFARFFRHRLALLGVSDAVRDDLRNQLSRWAPDRIETLYNRLDVENACAQLVSPAEARQKLNLPLDALVIANVGRLHPDKDQATLLRGFAAALPNLPAGTLLTVIGCGPLENELKRLAQQLELEDSVRFPGQILNVRNYFRAFDLFVLSSDREPFGMVLLEAMAAGVPVMATDCGGAPEVVGDSMMLFGVTDSKVLAKKIISFFNNATAGNARSYLQITQQRLERKFSDVAARKAFFGLPLVQNCLVKSGRH